MTDMYIFTRFAQIARLCCRNEVSELSNFQKFSPAFLLYFAFSLTYRICEEFTNPSEKLSKALFNPNKKALKIQGFFIGNLDMINSLAQVIQSHFLQHTDPTPPIIRQLSLDGLPIGHSLHPDLQTHHIAPNDLHPQQAAETSPMVEM